MGCFAWKIKAEKKNIFKDLIQMTWQGLKLLNYHSTKRPSFIIIIFITTIFESPINGLWVILIPGVKKKKNTTEEAALWTPGQAFFF